MSISGLIVKLPHASQLLRPQGDRQGALRHLLQPMNMGAHGTAVSVQTERHLLQGDPSSLTTCAIAMLSCQSCSECVCRA